MYIYVITNSATGKIYIGQHKGNNLRQYLQKKFYDAAKGRGGSSHLYNSMRKHPREVWSIEPLISDIQTKAELDRWERIYIALFDTRNPDIGYNICRGGEGFTGEFTAEHRAKLSTAAKITKNYLKSADVTRGVPRTLDVRTRISKSNTGKQHTLETRDKLREARLQQPDPRLGTTHSEETKKRISEAKKGNPSTFKGRHHTEEAKEKNRQAHTLNLQGQQFGGVVPILVVGSSSSKANWLVRCNTCGVEGVVRSDRVRNGDSRFMKTHAHAKNQLLQTNLEGRNKTYDHHHRIND